MTDEPVITEEEQWQHHSPAPESGLCESSWCDDAALPGEEYCRECIEEMVGEDDDREEVNPT